MNEQRFAGWCRIGRSTWRKIVEAQTDAEVWRLLPGLAPVAAQRDLCVVPIGTDPNVRPAMPPVVTGIRTTPIRK